MKMDAPEKIWAYDDGLGSPDSKTFNTQEIGVEYLRADIAQAMVTEVREKALREAAKAAGSIAVDMLKDEEPSASLVRLQFRRRALESKILALIDKEGQSDG